MKKLLFNLCIVFFVLLSTSFAQWETFEVIPISNNDFITAVDFIDQNTGCVGWFGIYRTTNAGQNWHSTEFTSAISDIKFFGQIGYATGASGTSLVFKTTNGGLNWHIIWSYYMGLSKISVINENTVILSANIGYEKKLYITTDAGVTWNTHFTTYEIYLVSGNAINNTGYAATQDNFYVRSGNEWLYRTNGGITCHSDIIYNNGRIYISGQAGTNGAINSTSNEGLTWQSVILNNVNQGICNEVDFIGRTGYGAGSVFTNNSITGKIYRTIDGQNWNEIYERPDKEFLDVAATSRYVYFVGRGGNIVRYDPLVTNIQNHDYEPNGFNLKQNYPNPFNPMTKIQYQIPKTENVMLKIFDISGKEVQALVNQKQNAGAYEVQLDGSKLSSGTYFYRLQAGDYIETKKMMLIK